MLLMINHCPNHSVEGIGLGEDNLKIVVYTCVAVDLPLAEGSETKHVHHFRTYVRPQMDFPLQLLTYLLCFHSKR